MSEQSQNQCGRATGEVDGRVLAGLDAARELLDVRSLLLLVGVLLLAHISVLFIHPPSSVPVASSGGLDTGIVFDAGGRGDESPREGADPDGGRAKHDLVAILSGVVAALDGGFVGRAAPPAALSRE